MFRFLEMRNSTAQLGALATGLLISMRSYRAISRQRQPKGCAFAMAARSKPFARQVVDELEVVSNGETIKTKVLVNASGAWANTVATMAGATELPLHPCRRHLFVSPPLDWVDPSWPFVWDVSHDIYFRPEGEGLLLCACDQQELPPGDPPVDETVQELLAEKIQNYIPALSRVSISKGWAGFRTLTADGRFVIGWDPKVKGLFWVAGLGGHGVTTSSAVGALAAELISGGPDERSDSFSPDRFISS